MTPLEEKIQKHVEFIGSDFTEEGKKQLRESYEDIATQAVEEEHARINEGLKYDLFPVQVREENPSYWSGYTDTVLKVQSIINKSN